MNSNLVKTTRVAENFLKAKGLPFSDLIELAPSNMEFNEGGSYGIEIPVVNSLKILEGLINEIKKQSVSCARFNETLGSFLLPDSEISEMLACCKENKYGIMFSLSPRPEYDIKSSFYRGNTGLSQGRRINNNDAFCAAVEEAIRLAELGCRGVIVYDLGLLSVLSLMRLEGVLPHDMIFKTSSHCIVSNPMTAKIFHEKGADSVTTSHDLGLPVLQEIRKLSPDLVLDVPIDVYPDKGGFIRFYEVAEIVQICAPVFLKIGASAQNGSSDNVTLETIEKRIKRVRVALDVLMRTLPDIKAIASNCVYKCMPAI